MGKCGLGDMRKWGIGDMKTWGHENSKTWGIEDMGIWIGDNEDIRAWVMRTSKLEDIWT